MCVSGCVPVPVCVHQKSSTSIKQEGSSQCVYRHVLISPPAVPTHTKPEVPSHPGRRQVCLLSIIIDLNQAVGLLHDNEAALYA